MPNIRFERSFDYSLIKRIICHEKIYGMVGDDFAPTAETFEPVQHSGIYYILVFDDAELLGLFAFGFTNNCCAEVHTCLLPHSWGIRAREASRGVIRWIFENTPCRRIFTNVPRFNRLALRFALNAGLTQFGVNEKSFQKNGTMHDQILLGISKPQE